MGGCGADGAGKDITAREAPFEHALPKLGTKKETEMISTGQDRKMVDVKTHLAPLARGSW